MTPLATGILILVAYVAIIAGVLRFLHICERTDDLAQAYLDTSVSPAAALGSRSAPGRDGSNTVPATLSAARPDGELGAGDVLNLHSQTSTGEGQPKS